MRGFAAIAGLVFVFGATFPAAAAADDFPDGYRAQHTYAEVRAELRQAASTHPNIVSLRSMGRSYEGRKLFIVKISDNVAADEDEPEVYVDGGIHAHEHLATEQALALIQWLVDGYGSDTRTTAIVDSTEIWIAPMVNPDGATYDIGGGTFHRWRKNRQPTPGSGEIGTDINRNFGYQWGGGGGSADPSDSFYRGPKAWSAPEARRIRDFVRSRVMGGVQQLRLALTLHSHGEFVMYPFGYTSNPSPPDMRPGDSGRLKALAQGTADRNGYRALQGGQLYRSSGTFMDWAYAKQRILALTLEMYPPASVDDGWYVRDEDMPAQLERNRDALLWFLEQASTPA
jgi:carboxypeptidase T